jgi:YidC/Oxa1 family membrane protein insertase
MADGRWENHRGKISLNFMDRTGIIVVSLCVVLLGFWFVEQKKQADRLQQQQAEYQRTHPQPVATNGTQSSVANSSTATANSVLTSPFDTNAPEQTIVLTNNRVRYTFTSRGGGIKLVELLDHPETISLKWQTKNSSATNGFASLNTHAPVPVLAILGDPNLVGDGNFALTKTDYGVRADKNLPDGLRLTKEFNFSSNFLVNASVRFENTSDKPVILPAQQFVVGTATPMDVDDIGMYTTALWFNGATPISCTASYFNTNTTVLGLFHRTVKPEYREGAGNVNWAAAENQFFALLVMTKTNQPAQQILATPVTLPSLAENAYPPVGIQTALIYPAQTISANSNFERQVILYAGPKEYRTLAKIGDDFQNRADLAMNWGTGYISFWGVGTFFAKLLLAGMNWLHDIFKVGYGWTIVLITILLRAAFWPLTAASTRSMKRMQALAPEVNALKAKYKDDPQKFTQKQMELWKKNKVSPVSGCLPMLIQMPVFFGFLAMIRCAIELRGAHFLWVADLTKPDTIFLIPGLNFPVNLLPLLMVGVMVWQAHLQPVSPGMDPSQQKMMRYMPLIFLVFLYNYSSGMALYMTVSTGLGILQMNLMKKQFPPTAAVSPLTPPQKLKK